MAYRNSSGLTKLVNAAAFVIVFGIALSHAASDSPSPSASASVTGQPSASAVETTQASSSASAKVDLTDYANTEITFSAADGTEISIPRYDGTSDVYTVSETPYFSAEDLGSTDVYFAVSDLDDLGRVGGEGIICKRQPLASDRE